MEFMKYLNDTNIHTYPNIVHEDMNLSLRFIAIWNIFIGNAYGKEIKSKFYSKIMHKMSNRNCDLIKNFVVHFFLSIFIFFCFSFFFFFHLVVAIFISKSNIYYVNQNLCMSPLAVKCRLCARHQCVYGVLYDFDLHA